MKSRDPDAGSGENQTTVFLSRMINQEKQKKERKSKRGGQKKRESEGLLVNVCSCSNSSASIIRGLIRKYGWVETKSKVQCHLLWTDLVAASTYDPFHRLLKAARDDSTAFGGRTNHFPDLDRFVTKASLMEHLSFFQGLWPKEYRFMPQEWNLPRQIASFQAQFREGATYILKPSAGSQGCGISVVQTWTGVMEYMSASPRSEHVAQEYIANPILLDGYKFDLRVYVLLESVTPLRAYVFRDGLARLCTEKYEAPASDNIHNPFIHLTNYHLNKENKKFKHADTYEEMKSSSKRSIRVALTQLKSQSPAFRLENFWEEIDEIISKTLIAIWPSLWGSYTKLFPPSLSARKKSAAEPDLQQRVPLPTLYMCSCEGRDQQFIAVYDAPHFGATVLGHISTGDLIVSQDQKDTWIRHATGWSPSLVDGLQVLSPLRDHLPPNLDEKQPSKCFHILGFDILLDQNMKAWLLEVNASPSFNLGSALDDYLKVSLVERSLSLMKFISRADIERAKTLLRQQRLRSALKSQMSLLRWRERRARRMMLKSQFWERDFLSKKREELDDIRSNIKRTGKLQLQVEQEIKDFLRIARKEQGLFVNEFGCKISASRGYDKKQSNVEERSKESKEVKQMPGEEAQLKTKTREVNNICDTEPGAGSGKRSSVTLPVSRHVDISRDEGSSSQEGRRRPHSRNRSDVPHRPSSRSREPDSKLSPFLSSTIHEKRALRKYVQGLREQSRTESRGSRKPQSQSAGHKRMKSPQDLRDLFPGLPELKREQEKRPVASSTRALVAAFPRSFESLRCKEVVPFCRYPQLGLSSSPVLRIMYLECNTDKGLSSSKFTRVMKSYGLLKGGGSRARASLTFLQNTKSSRSGRESAKSQSSSNLQTTSFMDFCQMILLIALKRFPGRRPIKALQLLLKHVYTKLCKNFRERCTRKSAVARSVSKRRTACMKS